MFIFCSFFLFEVASVSVTVSAIFFISFKMKFLFAVLIFYHHFLFDKFKQDIFS